MKKLALVVSLLFALPSMACQFDKVSFDTDFDGGRLDKCHQVNDNTFKLTLKPENTPINDSPWYSFKVKTDSAMEVKIIMAVEDGSHRYPPKVSDDGKHWQLLENKIKRDKLSFTVDVKDKPVWVSAQEIINNEDYIRWGKKLAQSSVVEHELLGLSTEKRGIYQLVVKQNPDAKKWLLVLGRQHPPELTGAMALLPFSEALLSTSDLATKFREQYNILIIPNLNPDGVYHGNWRHNANGKDLNRQWKNFEEVEAALVHDYLSTLVAKGHSITYAVDFHSTHKDIFYTMPTHYVKKEPFSTVNWLNKLDSQWPEFKVIQQPGNNPDKGVFKQYIADTYNVHAITYEMGDNTNRFFIDKLAKDAATSLMQTLLTDNNQQE
jgi:hypothetical protein